MPRIHCCVCEVEVEAEEATGADIYPRIPRLAQKRFWRCPTCLGYVGSHRDGKPLGCIPTPELRRARSMIRDILDPIWKQGLISRNELYSRVSEALGIRTGFHTAEIRSIGEARDAYRAIRRIRRDLTA